MQYKIGMKGQILLEALVALSIATVVITVVTSTVLSSLNNSIESKNQNRATQYAQEGMEVMRSHADVAVGTTGCLGKGITQLQPNCTTPNIDGIFIRRVAVTSSPISCGTSLKQVRITVSWADAKCATGTYCNSVPLVSCLPI